MNRDELKQEALLAANTALSGLVFKLKVLLVMGAVAGALLGVLKLLEVGE